MTESVESARPVRTVESLGVVRNWSFHPTQRSVSDITLAWLRGFRRKPRPDSLVLKPLVAVGEWAIVFVFAPDQQLQPRHEFTLRRLRDEGFRVAVICATAERGKVPDALNQYCDALYWKDLPGFDFSAYTLALEEAVARIAGSDVLILNDSVFGPLNPLKPLLRQSRWDLTGFTGAKGVENHIQSYAFRFREVDAGKLAAMRQIFPSGYCFNHMGSVVGCQEIPMARIAHRSMRVGSLWFPQSPNIDDPCLDVPERLLEDGFPFLKRSLLGKFSFFGKRDVALQCLARYGHPEAS
jgi:lipopolysaccharide biosynthesis protein